MEVKFTIKKNDKSPPNFEIHKIINIYEHNDLESLKHATHEVKIFIKYLQMETLVSFIPSILTHNHMALK